MSSDQKNGMLQIALASYDPGELRVQKNYLEEQNASLVCTGYRQGAQLLEQLRRGTQYDVIVLCSQLEDMSGGEFVEKLRVLDNKPLLMLFDEGRRQVDAALSAGADVQCPERMELKSLLRALYRIPGQQGQHLERQCQQLYRKWGMHLPEINCGYLTSAVNIIYASPDKMAIRKEVLQPVSEQYGVSVSAVDSGIRRLVDQLENRNCAEWNAFKLENGFEREKPTTGKLIYAVKRQLLRMENDD